MAPLIITTARCDLIQTLYLNCQPGVNVRRWEQISVQKLQNHHVRESDVPVLQRNVWKGKGSMMAGDAMLTVVVVVGIPVAVVIERGWGDSLSLGKGYIPARLLCGEVTHSSERNPKELPSGVKHDVPLHHNCAQIEYRELFQPGCLEFSLERERSWWQRWECISTASFHVKPSQLGYVTLFAIVGWWDQRGAKRVMGHCTEFPLYSSTASWWWSWGFPRMLEVDGTRTWSLCLGCV